MLGNHRSARVVAVLGFAAAGLLASAGPSDAYRMIQNTSTGRVTAGSAVSCSASGGFTHWTTPNINWYHNTAGQGSGKTTALQNAMASWTNVTSANHVLTYAGTTSSGWATDGKNTILWASGNGCTGSCLALTALVLQSGQVIVESDITFNTSYTWKTDGTDYDTESVAAHELGHALGIHHTELTSTPRPTMYASYFGSGGRSLETDDRSALQCAESKYPLVPPFSVSISGPSSLTLHQSSLFTANPIGGTGSYTYRWYIWAQGGSGWYDSGVTTQSTYASINSCGIAYFDLKVAVTSGTQTKESIKRVTISNPC